MNSRKILSAILIMIMALISLAACNSDTQGAETIITMSNERITVNGKNIENGDSVSVYTSNDIIYYEDRVTYDSGNPYGEGEPSERHSAEVADSHTVINITKPGTYRLTGELELGQVRIDLGEEAKTDPTAVVELILDSVNINCEVAPAILFLNVYECDNKWSAETATYDVDTTAAGANIIIADNSENIINGSHVARIYKDQAEEKKLWKQDAAVYSYMSMNVSGNTGLLDITADNEGLDTELHLTINGGNINIRSGNDGINTNEDGVSVTTINGGNLRIIAGLGDEGDGIDSNGWLVINGGSVIASANPAADAGLDSDMGSFVNGGTVVALGSTMDWAESDSNQVTMNLQFAEYKQSDDAIIITREDGSVVFAYDPSEDEIVGSDVRRYKGAVISSPDFALEDTYNVYIGGNIVGSEISGVYDPSSITSYTGAVIQSFTGTDVEFRPNFNREQMGGNNYGHGFVRPDDMPEFPKGDMPNTPEMKPDEFPEMPKDEFPQRGNDRENMERPDREDFQMKGERPDGIPEMPGAEGNDAMLANTQFYMQDKVNCFSGIGDYSDPATTL